MSDFLPFVTVGGKLSWSAMLGLALFILLVLFVAKKIPGLRAAV